MIVLCSTGLPLRAGGKDAVSSLLTRHACGTVRHYLYGGMSSWVNRKGKDECRRRKEA